jgi:hypothetical protein|tara:strand:- start:45 stop:617 length:573 start_codon:yes stop_codon:yes gene_type:complete
MSSPFSKKFMSKKPVAFMTAKQSSNLNPGLKEAIVKDEKQNTPAAMKYDAPTSMTASSAPTQMSPLNQNLQDFFESFEEDGGNFEGFNSIYSPESLEGRGSTMAEALGSDSSVEGPTVFNDAQREMIPEMYQAGVDISGLRKALKAGAKGGKNLSTDEREGVSKTAAELKRLIGVYNTFQDRMGKTNMRK